MRWIILDTETTGLDPAFGHRIIEIGAVEVLNRNITGRHFHTYLNPDRESDEGALQVHGLTMGEPKSTPQLKSSSTCTRNTLTLSKIPLSTSNNSLV